MQDQNQSSAGLPQTNPLPGQPGSGQSAGSDLNQPKKKKEILPAENQQISQSLPAPTGGTSVQIDTPNEAADSDLIEKEWVEKAKQIVERTRDNPYQQQEELSKMKAEYLKKRYNREINSPSE